MTDGRKNLFERLKPIWEAVDELGEIDPEFDTKADLDEMWEEYLTESVGLGEARDSLDISDAELADDLEVQFRVISAAYATGEAVKIDRAMKQIATIRRMKKLGYFRSGDPHKSDPDD